MVCACVRVGQAATASRISLVAPQRSTESSDRESRSPSRHAETKRCLNPRCLSARLRSRAFRIPRIAKEINLLDELFVDYEEQVCGLLENRKTTDLRGLLEKGKKGR